MFSILDQSSDKNSNGKRVLQNLPTVPKKLKVSSFTERCRTKLVISSRKELATSTFTQNLTELRVKSIDFTNIPIKFYHCVSAHWFRLVNHSSFSGQTYEAPNPGLVREQTL
jgi:hypothetical protein